MDRFYRIRSKLCFLVSFLIFSFIISDLSGLNLCFDLETAYAATLTCDKCGVKSSTAHEGELHNKYCGTFTSAVYECSEGHMFTSGGSCTHIVCTGTFTAVKYECTGCGATSSTAGEHLKECGGTYASGYKCTNEEHTAVLSTSGTCSVDTCNTAVSRISGSHTDVKWSNYESVSTCPQCHGSGKCSGGGSKKNCTHKSYPCWSDGTCGLCYDQHWDEDGDKSSTSDSGASEVRYWRCDTCGTDSTGPPMKHKYECVNGHSMGTYSSGAPTWHNKLCGKKLKSTGNYKCENGHDSTKSGKCTTEYKCGDFVPVEYECSVCKETSEYSGTHNKRCGLTCRAKYYCTGGCGEYKTTKGGEHYVDCGYFIADEIIIITNTPTPTPYIEVQVTSTPTPTPEITIGPPVSLPPTNTPTPVPTNTPTPIPMCNITFNGNGGLVYPYSNGTGMEVWSFSVPWQTPISAPDVYWDNKHEFLSWGKTVGPAALRDYLNYYEAQWEVLDNEVFFNGNGNTSGSMTSYNLGQTKQDGVLPKCTFERIGYKFVGWATENHYYNKIVDYDDCSEITGVYGPMMLYAIWEPLSYNVKYSASEYVVDVTPPPSVVDSAVESWQYIDNHEITQYKISVNSDRFKSIRLEPWKKWYNVLYDTNRIPSMSTEPVPVLTQASDDYPDAVVLTETNNRAYFDFLTWRAIKKAKSSDESDVEVQRLAQGTTEVRNLVTPIEGITETIVFYPEWVRTANQVILPETSADGYIFDGWHTSSNKEDVIGVLKAGTGYVPTFNNTTLYAVWTPKHYLIDLIWDSSQPQYNNVVEMVFDDISPKVAVPTRFGYTFGGYYTEPNGSGIQWYNKDGVSDRRWIYYDGTFTELYAEWIPIRSIIYKPGDGAYGIMENSTSELNNGYTPSIKLSLCNFVKRGYEFKEWVGSDGNKYANGAVVENMTEDVTVTATWKPISVNVIFEVTDGTCDTSSKSVTYDSTYGTLPVPSRPGYTFSGWRFKDTGDLCTSSTKMSRITEHTLVPIWKENTYKITFDWNWDWKYDAVSKVPDYSSESMKVTYGFSYGSLPNPKRDGYTFGGWYLTDPSGATDLSGYTRIDSDDIFAYTTDITVYALWTQNSYDVTLDQNQDYSVQD